MPVRGVGLGEELAQAVEAALPLRPMLSDPPLRTLQPPRLEAAGADPTDLLGPDDTAVLEDLDVLHDGRERHREGGSELADRNWSAAQLLNHRSASGVSQRPEGVIQLRRAMHHAFESNSACPDSQALT